MCYRSSHIMFTLYQIKYTSILYYYQTSPPSLEDNFIFIFLLTFFFNTYLLSLSPSLFHCISSLHGKVIPIVKNSFIIMLKPKFFSVALEEINTQTVSNALFVENHDLMLQMMSYDKDCIHKKIAKPICILSNITVPKF